MFRMRHHPTLLVIPCILVLLLALVACGTNYSTNGPGSLLAAASPTASSTQSSTSGSTPTPTSTTTPFQNQKTEDGCPGNQVITTAPPAATFTLTEASNKKTALNKGDTLNIELPFGLAWAGPLNFSQGVLAMQSPAGDAYSAVKACIWHFTAVSDGTVSLSFSGRPICQERHACPQYMLEPFQFVVTVPIVN